MACFGFDYIGSFDCTHLLYIYIVYYVIFIHISISQCFDLSLLVLEGAILYIIYMQSCAKSMCRLSHFLWIYAWYKKFIKLQFMLCKQLFIIQFSILDFRRIRSRIQTPNISVYTLAYLDSFYNPIYMLFLGLRHYKILEKYSYNLQFIINQFWQFIQINILFCCIVDGGVCCPSVQTIKRLLSCQVCLSQWFLMIIEFTHMGMMVQSHKVFCLCSPGQYSGEEKQNPNTILNI
eukprot:TRINITY_DN43567_c0_g2_i1.p2 TRINITY_DN43567_c0_g2~~TRINITY_DN43567_c0_g2_i1.p2  ORF type:complete len:234 (+),score=-14.56 TRINITY_DN43567_c0_g2_i1:289-990(+)